MKINKTLRYALTGAALVAFAGCGLGEDKKPGTHAIKNWITDVSIDSKYGVWVIYAHVDSTGIRNYEMRVWSTGNPGTLILQGQNGGIMPERMNFYNVPQNDSRRELCGSRLRSLIEEVIEKEKLSHMDPGGYGGN